MNRQVRAYGSVAILTASALLIIINNEMIMQAAIAAQRRWRVPTPRGTTSHNRMLSRGATRRKLRISSAGKNSLFYDLRISRPQTFMSRLCCKFCDLYASIYGNSLWSKSLQCTNRPKTACIPLPNIRQTVDFSKLTSLFLFACDCHIVS